MNAMNKSSFLPCLALISGTAAFGLRKCLYAFAVDQRGLLISGHPLSFALWAVVAAAAAFLLWQVRKTEGSNTYETAFAPSRLSAGACAFLAGSLLVTVLNHTPALGNVAAAWKVLGFLSAPAVMWAGICRSKGRKPFFGVHGLLCLFLLIHMVSRYQVWSSNPQLQDYIFELLAAVALTLFSYHCAAFEADMGSRRMYLATGLLAVLLCAAALSGTGTPGLYLGGLVWAFADLCTLTPPPKDEVTAHDPA